MQRPARPSSGPSAIVLAARVLIGALAAGAVVGALVVSRSGPPANAQRYACPMHSEVTAAEPGDCPICGMALEEVDPASPPASRGAIAHEAAERSRDDIALAGLRESDEAISLLRFSVAPARRNALPGEVFAPAVVEADGTITALLYRDELASLTPDERAELVPSARGRAALAIERVPDAPVAAVPDAALVQVAFRPAAGQPAAPAGEVGWVKLGYKIRAMLVVRSTAILRGPDGRYVLVFSAQRGQLTRRRVEVGKEYAGMTAIVAGLRDKEFVVMANTYALDAERRLKAAP